MSEKNSAFDFLITDRDEIVLILSAQDTPPDTPAVRLHPDSKTVELFRHPGDAYTLENVDDEVFSLLAEEEVLLVCETAQTDNPDETEIVYTYEAVIIE
ncbi:MAG: hypothetical protein J6039_00350 [Alphaproteobacteria bacterium]|nr:hypothetical protein [Alphaproteobacteria bacterium]